jgi:hypothetical protein
MQQFNEKQLRYLSRAIQEDINGLNPFVRKNIFKIGKNKITDYIVSGVQFCNEAYKEIKWSNTYMNIPYLENYDNKGIKFYFKVDIDKNSNKIEINKNMTACEIYLLISKLQDSIEQ